MEFDDLLNFVTHCIAQAPFLILDLQQLLIIPFDLLPDEGVLQTAHLLQLEVQPPLPYLPR
jgi:hypothetical protein